MSESTTFYLALYSTNLIRRAARIINRKWKKPSIRTIYSLSTTEQEVFKKLINKNLNNEFIQLASSLYGAPVLFIKKKNGSFHLYVNFWGLNCIIQNNRYLLSLISNLLDSLWKTHIYTKINLCHIYYLVWIVEGNG